MQKMAPLFLKVAFLFVFLVVCFVWSRRCRRLRQLRLLHIDSLEPHAHAHAILTHTICVEFPFLTRTALEFALLRSLAIPSISDRLHRFGHFSSGFLKRYDDTYLLILEMLLHHSENHRGSTALRRVNFIHSKHPTITNDEYLYVLSLLIIWPPRFCKRYGHRQWSATEELAYFYVWQDIGAKMGIRDLPASLPAAVEFSERYEAAHMAYADSNGAVAEPVFALLLAEFPAFLRPLAQRVVFAMMDDGLMAAMGYPAQPRWLRSCVEGALRLSTGVFVWRLMPPRPLEKAVIRIGQLGGGDSPPSEADASGKIRVQFSRFRSQRGEYEEKGYRIEELGMVQPGKLAPPPVTAAELPFPLSVWPASLFSSGEGGPAEKGDEKKE